MMAAIAAAGAGARVTILEQNGSLERKFYRPEMENAILPIYGRCQVLTERAPGFCHGGHQPIPGAGDDPVLSGDGTLLQEPGWVSLSSFGTGAGGTGRAGHGIKASTGKSGNQCVCEREIHKERFHITAEQYLQRPEKKSKKRTVLVTVGEEEQTYEADHVILTAGGLAGRVQRADGTGMRMAGKLGHTIVPCVPALVQLMCEEAFCERFRACVPERR